MTKPLRVVVSEVPFFATYYSSNGTTAIVFRNQELPDGVQEALLEEVSKLKGISGLPWVINRRVDGCMYLSPP